MTGPEPGRLPAPRFGQRLLCLLYEALLLTAVCLAATLLVLLPAHAAGVSVPRAVLQLYLLAVGAAYFVPQWRAGQTLAMRTWRIRVEAADASRLTLQRSLLRYALATLNWLVLGAGYLWALADRDRQFLHDRLAGTRLVAVPR